MARSALRSSCNIISGDDPHGPPCRGLRQRRTERVDRVWLDHDVGLRVGAEPARVFQPDGQVGGPAAATRSLDAELARDDRPQAITRPISTLRAA